MKISLGLQFALLLAITFGSSNNTFAQTEIPMSFSNVVDQHFSQWDKDGNGQLSGEETDLAMANPKVRNESAAAIAAIENVVRGNKYTLPPITKDYLVSSPLREPSTSDEEADSADDISKPEKFGHAPAFQPRYLKAMQKLRQTSRELFPQGLPSFEATHQGALGDCPFVSTVGAMVYRNPSAVKSMFTQNATGSFTVTFGGGRSIKIAHITDSDIAIWSSAGTNGLWMTLLEKAYRRVLVATDHPEKQGKPKIYDKFGPSLFTIEILDGHEAYKVVLKKIQPDSPDFSNLRHDLIAAKKENCLIKAGTSDNHKRAPGIPGGHAFAILDYNQKSDLVHVWNPWGNNFTPKGPDSLQNGYTTKRGEFDIPLKDLIQIYSDINVETQTPVRN